MNRWEIEGECGRRDSWFGLGHGPSGWVIAWTVDPAARPEGPGSVPQEWFWQPLAERGAELYPERDGAVLALARYIEEFGWSE